jgi:hypothetical protein
MSQKRAASAGLQLENFQVNTGPLAFGAAMIGAGVILGLAGMAISGSVVLVATKRWIDQLETPPTELARQKWAQARAATQAGANAWQNGLVTSTRGS